VAMTVVETIERNAKLISVAYLSEVSGIPRETLYKTIGSGSLPVYRIGGAIWIEPREAGKWLRDHSTGK
jgi:hypothetical protein